MTQGSPAEAGGGLPAAARAALDVGAEVGHRGDGEAGAQT